MKSPNVIIFHGTSGHPKENWFPYLTRELARDGIAVTIPQFPTPEGQSLDAWLNIFKVYEGQTNDNTILIGHSLGGLFLLRLLERINQKVRAAIFVAATVGVRPIKFYDADEKFSPGFNFDWDAIKTKASHFSVYHSDNDPYVSLGNGEALAKNLGVPLHFVPNAGHFNAAAGYLEFPLLLNEVKGILKTECQ